MLACDLTRALSGTGAVPCLATAMSLLCAVIFRETMVSGKLDNDQRTTSFCLTAAHRKLKTSCCPKLKQRASSFRSFTPYTCAALKISTLAHFRRLTQVVNNLAVTLSTNALCTRPPHVFILPRWHGPDSRESHTNPLVGHRRPPIDAAWLFCFQPANAMACGYDDANKITDTVLGGVQKTITSFKS